MYSKVKLFGHPLHTMLVAFPIALYVLSFVGFFTYQTISAEAFWYRLGYFSTVAAIVCALLAAIPGFIDLTFGVPNKSPAKKTGMKHAGWNIAALIMFICNAIVINGTWNVIPINATPSVWLTALGCLLVIPAGFLGYKMVGTHKVGVELSPEQARLEQDKYSQWREDGRSEFASDKHAVAREVPPASDLATQGSGSREIPIRNGRRTSGSDVNR